MTAEVSKVEEKQVESEVVVVAPEETTVKAVVEEEEVKAVVETEVVEGDDESKPKGVEKSSSFKEESDFFSDLKDSEKKALSDLKSKLEEAIVENYLFKKKKETPVKEKKEAEVEKKTEEKKPEEDKNPEAVVTEESPKEEAKAETVEGSPKEEVKTETVVATEEKKPEEEKKSEAVVSEETPKEEVKTETVIVKEEGIKEEVKAESVEEKKTEAVVIEEVKAADEKKTVEAKAETSEKEEEDETVDKDIELWGVPLLPSKGAEGTDVILLKFLRARDFKVNEAFEMLKKTLQWRKQHNIDSILGEEFGEDLAPAASMNGVDRESRPVCYNFHGVFQNEELYQTTFGSEKSREKFLRWRFQLMERGIQKLDLKPGGVTSILQIHDLKNAPALSRKDLWVASKHAIDALQDNYPEFVSRNIFVNVPFWFYAVRSLLSPFLTQRTKSKFVVAHPAKVTETLLKYIPAEEIPVQYGGFKRDNDTEFSNETVSEVVVKPGSSELIEIPAPETEGTLVWDIAVLGWEVNYKEEFVPTNEGAYTIIVQKGKKVESNEGAMRNSFKYSESGKIVLTVDNVSSKKKRVLYRYRTKTESSC